MENMKADFLIAAYKAHKDEITLRRRMEAMTTGFTMLFYSTCTFYVLLNETAQNMLAGSYPKAAATIIFCLIANVLCYFLYKNYKRHCELQEILASIDQAFGFFVKGAYITDKTVYPDDWQNAGQLRDFGMFSRAAIVLVFTVVAIITLWVKAF